MSNTHDIQILNGLIQTTADSADAYHDAAAETDDGGRRALFKRRAFARQKVAADLSADVRGLGGEPTVEGSILAKAQRAFGDLKHALVRDELSIVGPVEGVEDTVRTRFEKALEDSNVSATTRDAIRRAYARLHGDHDDISALKHSLEGQRDDSSRLFPH